MLALICLNVPFWTVTPLGQSLIWHAVQRAIRVPYDSGLETLFSCSRVFRCTQSVLQYRHYHNPHHLQ
jgi:hypothetical protein